MRFDIILSATLASAVAGSAIPKDAALVERQSGNLQCGNPTTGPYFDQVVRGIPYLGDASSDQICLTRVGACDRVDQFGTAGFRVCSVVENGNAPPCFAKADLTKYFYAITQKCPNSEPGSIWSRISGTYTLAASELPAGTIWAQLVLENIPETPSA